MKRWLVFGRNTNDEAFGGPDAYWWPIYAHESIRGKSADSVMTRIALRLAQNGEEDWDQLAVVPFDAWTEQNTESSQS